MYSLVSVIMPSYNSEKLIGFSIKSVLDQTYTNLELIIVDDCSSDSSVEVINSFKKKDIRIQLIELPKNSGAAVARNMGIEKAKGKWIAFLDSDDLWVENKLETQIKFMIGNKLSFAFSNYDFVGMNGDFKQRHKSIRTPLTYNDMLKSNFIGCLTAIYDQESIGKVFMPLIRKRQDYGLWLRILKVLPEVHGIQKPLAYYRLQNQSISSNKFEMLKWNWKLFYQVEKVGFFKSLLYLSQNIIYKIFH